MTLPSSAGAARRVGAVLICALAISSLLLAPWPAAGQVSEVMAWASLATAVVVSIIAILRGVVPVLPLLAIALSVVAIVVNVSLGHAVVPVRQSHGGDGYGDGPARVAGGRPPLFG